MAKKTEYKVSGTLKTKPESLPEGLTVTEVKTTLREKLTGAFGEVLRVEESITYPEGVYIGCEGSTGVHLTHENTKALREHLDTLLGGLRIVHDGADSVNSVFRWVEVEPNKFAYLYGDEKVPDKATSNMKSFEYIVDNYGTPRSVTFR
jgi:hypothetical protein